MTDTPQILLAHHLKALKLPTFLREYDKLARQCAAEASTIPVTCAAGRDEMIDRERRMVERRIKAARFPDRQEPRTASTSCLAIAEKMLVLELALADYVERRENIIAVGNSARARAHCARARLGRLSEGLSVASSRRRLSSTNCSKP